MIDPHWQVIDLDPVTWRNLGPFFQPQDYIAAAQPDEHGLFILHDRGQLLKVVDTLTADAPADIPTQIDDPVALARDLYERGEWQRVHIIDRRHLAWGGFAQAELRLVGGHRATGGHVHLLVEPGLLQPGGAKSGIDMRQAEPIDCQVGGGVVADDHHEGERVAQGERERRRELGKDAGAFDLVLMIEDEFLGERGVTGADLFGRIQQNAELDGGSGLHRKVGRKRGGLAGAQVVGVNGQGAVMGGGDGLKLLIQLLIFPWRGLGE